MILATFRQLTNTLPTGVLCFLFVSSMVLLSQLGLSLFNKWNKRTRVTDNNEVAGIMFGALSLIYSLILAFVIVAVWEDYEELENNIQSETDKMNNIITHISIMPDSIKTPIQQALYNYCELVTTDEWDMDSDSIENQSSAIPSLRLMLLTIQQQNDFQQDVLAVVDDDLSQITDLRRGRLKHNHSQIPDLVWFILKSGTVLLIVFSYFFQVASMKLKRIYLSFLTSCLAMCLYLVSALDHPFDDNMQLSKKPYYNIQHALLKNGAITQQ